MNWDRRRVSFFFLELNFCMIRADLLKLKSIKMGKLKKNPKTFIVVVTDQDPPFRLDKSPTVVILLFHFRSSLFLTQNKVNVCLQIPAVVLAHAIPQSVKQTRKSERRPIKLRLQKPSIKTENYRDDVSERRKGWRQRQGQNIPKF